jgi:hypothetical protein
MFGIETIQGTALISILAMLVSATMATWIASFFRTACISSYQRTLVAISGAALVAMICPLVIHDMSTLGTVLLGATFSASLLAVVAWCYAFFDYLRASASMRVR